MIGRPASHLIEGPAGALEVVLQAPSTVAPVGLAVVAHPHPLQGGTMDNKVVHTLARALNEAGWSAVRFNFRGVGASEGTFDEGRGEQDDLLAVLDHHRNDPCWSADAPVLLAGFSFGGFVAASAAQRLAQSGRDLRSLVLVSPATSRYAVPPVPLSSLVVQGEADDVVPMAAIFDWARPQGLPVTVLPGAGHFFHGQLGTLRQIVATHLRALR